MSLSFEAIGTAWVIDSAVPISSELASLIEQRVESFDRTWSRFRDDSLVARIAREPGTFRFPDEAPALFDLYRRLYEATDAALSPLVGRTLETLGYDRSYSLTPTANPAPVPSWDDAVSWDGESLMTVRPVVLDVGAAGKGYLVDLLAELLEKHGHAEYTVDGSGDLRHRGPAPLRVALEHPGDTSKAIGIVELSDGSMCSSATNRRAWAGVHHVIDATTGLPTRNVIATWVVASSTVVADGLSTALFFVEPARLAAQFDFEYVRMFADGRVEFSRKLSGEVFT